MLIFYAYCRTLLKCVARYYLLYKLATNQKHLECKRRRIPDSFWPRMRPRNYRCLDLINFHDARLSFISSLNSSCIHTSRVCFFLLSPLLFKFIGDILTSDLRLLCYWCIYSWEYCKYGRTKEIHNEQQRKTKNFERITFIRGDNRLDGISYVECYYSDANSGFIWLDASCAFAYNSSPISHSKHSDYVLLNYDREPPLRHF